MTRANSETGAPETFDIKFGESMRSLGWFREVKERGRLFSEYLDELLPPNPAARTWKLVPPPTLARLGDGAF